MYIVVYNLDHKKQIKLKRHPQTGILTLVPLLGLDYSSDLFPGEISWFYTVLASYTELRYTVIVSVRSL